MSLDKALAFTLKWEGGYVNDKDDPGGATNFGVTQKTYDAYRATFNLPLRDVRDISSDEVKALYDRDYWHKSGASELPEPLDMIHFDAAVNHGVGQALKFLLRARTANPNAPDKPYLEAREAFYRDLVARKPVMGKFLKGWLRRVDDLRKAAGY